MKAFERLKTERNGEKWLPDHPNGHSDYGMMTMKNLFSVPVKDTSMAAIHV